MLRETGGVRALKEVAMLRMVGMEPPAWRGRRLRADITWEESQYFRAEGEWS